MSPGSKEKMVQSFHELGSCEHLTYPDLFTLLATRLVSTGNLYNGRQPKQESLEHSVAAWGPTGTKRNEYM